ncbi:unnamed protein product [Arctia plantaginis]|uniref:Uncharacterized protein n=1 Tax=Arctia plantaginis TaxID=874455 RepID=A0A8S1AFI7_ARCPL|nr:unnamed protein product [Arctia plantaginis]
MELAMREVYTDCKKDAEKRIIKKVTLKIGEKLCKKPERKYLGLKSQVRKPCYKKKPLNKNIAEELEKFYGRDDISRNTAGKRETRTKNKKKVQIRYLVDTLQNLYQIYKDEGGKYSFTSFFRYKPYYILSPNVMTRNTCMCIKHSNIEFIFDALKLKGIMPHKNTTELLSNVACDTKSYDCMYNKCQQCKIPRIQYNEDKSQGEVTWFKWGRVVHKYEKAGQEMITKKTIKQQIKGTVRDLIMELEKELPTFKTHCFNWKEQQRQYRVCVTNMKDKEISILCDFSENYECHGKSMADGIGGSVKRQLDKRVSHGHDITNATEACHILQSTMKSVKCFYVSDDDVQNFKKLIPDGLRAVPGTMQLHQVISVQAHQIQYRQLSCFCGEMRGLCCCHHPKTHFLTDQMAPFTEAPEISLPAIMANEPSVIPIVVCPDPEPSFSSPKPSTSCDDGTGRASFPPVFEISTNCPSHIAFDEMDVKCDGNNLIESVDAETDLLSIDIRSLENISEIFGECPSSDIKIPEDVPVLDFPKITTYNAEVPQTIKRVKIHKPFDDDQIQITPPIKRVKPLNPCGVSFHDKSNKKSIKVLLPKIEKENQTKGKTNASSSRTFPCVICKTRQRFILQEMAKCMVCKKWVCISCSGTTAFDFICPVCLSD